MNVGVHEAKTHLSRLISSVEAGEDVVIHRGGKPVARLVAVFDQAPKSLIGALQGRINYSRFDEPLPDDLLAAFSGETR
jgi:prevent-host-death family protein